MAGVDEAAQAVGAAVGALRREPVDAVVAPVARAGEAGDGQDLDGGDAEIDEPIERADGGVERALGREGADVELVEDEVAHAPRAARVLPGEGARIDHLRRAVHAVRLRARGGIGAAPLAVEHVPVARAGADAVDDGLEPAVAGAAASPRARLRGATSSSSMLRGLGAHTRKRVRSPSTMAPIMAEVLSARGPCTSFSWSARGRRGGRAV